MTHEPDRPTTAEDAIRRAHEILAEYGIDLSSSKVTRLARDFVRADPPCTFATYVKRNTAIGEAADAASETTTRLMSSYPGASARNRGIGSHRPALPERSPRR